MGAVRARVRADFRRRWPAWLGLVLAIGLAGTVVLTAAAGARRTGTAYDRFLAQSHAEDLYFSVGRPSDPAVAAMLTKVEHLPQVEAAGRVTAANVYGRDSGPDTPYQYGAVDDRYGNTIDRPNVVEGRRPDPRRADEMLVNRAVAREQGIEVGDTLQWYSFEPQELETDEVKVSDATRVRLRVVGIGVYPNEVVPTAQYDAAPFAYLTPAFFRAHPREVQDYSFEVVRLKHGSADVPAFRRGLSSVLRSVGEDPNVSFFAARSESYDQVRRAIQPQALALGLFAALTAVAFLMVIVQILGRQIFLDREDYAILGRLGMTRRQLFATAMVRVLAVAVVGGLLAVVGAVLASPLMPIGPARLAEPHRGIAVDLVVLGPGIVLLVGLLVGLAAIPAWRMARALGEDSDRAHHPSRTVETLARRSLPASWLLGVRNALQPGRGRARVPVRSTMVVSGLAIALVVATASFTENLNHLATTPHAYGWNWTFKAGNGFFPVDVDQSLQALRKVPGVAAVAGATYGDISIGGRPVGSVGIDPLRGEVFPTLLEGRAPVDEHEIVLGTRTLRQSGRHLGDRVEVVIRGEPRRMRIVGRAIFPKLGAGSFSPTNLGFGAATTVDALVPANTTRDDKYNVLLITMRPGATASRAALNRVLRPLEFCGGETFCVELPDRPGDVRNYTRVRGTSVVLAGVLALIALGMLAHALVSSVRRRRRDVALYKTLGFVRRQVAAVSAWQAATMATVALVIGVPVGLAVGTVTWRLFAEQLGVAPDTVIPAAVLLAIPAVLLLAIIVAIVPALFAARTRPAAVLRSE